MFFGACQRSISRYPYMLAASPCDLSIESSDSFVASASALMAIHWSEPNAHKFVQRRHERLLHGSASVTRFVQALSQPAVFMRGVVSLGQLDPLPGAYG